MTDNPKKKEEQKETAIPAGRTSEKKDNDKFSPGEDPDYNAEDFSTD